MGGREMNTPRTDAAVKLTFDAIRELNRLLRFCAERPGGAVMSQRMEGAADARHAIRKEIRERIRELERAQTVLPGIRYRRVPKAGT